MRMVLGTRAEDSNQLGEEIDDWLIDNMAHVNSGIPTRVRQLGHAMVETAPDITIVHSSVASSCSWGGFGNSWF